jgi:hypothetical protein
MISIKKIGIIGISCLLVFGVFWIYYDWTAAEKNTEWQLHATGINIKNNRQIFTWINAPINGSLIDFFNQKTTLENIPIHKSIITKELKISRISPNIWRIKSDEIIGIFVSAAITEAELKNNLIQPTSLQSDYWVLETKTEFLSSYLPSPAQSVFILDSRKLTKFWRHWSEKNQIPVVPVASFGDQVLQIIDTKIIIP